MGNKSADDSGGLSRFQNPRFHPVHLIADLAAVGFDVAEGGLVALAGGVLGYFLEADGFEKRSELR